MDARKRFGDAGFPDEQALRIAGIIGGDEGAFFGFYQGQECRFASDGSIAVVGGARSGKSSCLFALNEITNYLQCNGIAFDTRSELSTLSNLAVSKQGFFHYFFNPFGLSGLPSHTCNIFDDLTPDNPNLIADAGKRINDFLPHTGGQKWWQDEAHTIVKSFLLACVERDRRVSMPTLYRELMNVRGDHEAWTAFSALMQRSQYLEVRNCVQTVMDAQDDNTGDGFRAPQNSIASAFAFMQIPNISRALDAPNGNDFSLGVVNSRTQKAKVKVIIPLKYVEQCQGLIRSMFGYVIQQKIGNPDYRISVSIDECSQLGYFPSVLDLFSFAGGENITGICSWQEKSFLEDAFGVAGADKIMGSAPLAVWAGIRTRNSANAVSSLGGITTHNYIDLDAAAHAAHGQQQAILRLIQNGDLSEAAEAFQHFQHMTTTPKQVRGELLPTDAALNHKGMIAFAPGLVNGPILGQWTRYFELPHLAGEYLGVPQHGLEAVTITTKSGRQIQRRVITETCPPALAHLPQYQGGTWQYVEGYRPQGFDGQAAKPLALPSLPTRAVPFQVKPKAARSSWGRERF